MARREFAEPVPTILARTLTNQVTRVKTADPDFCDLAVVLLPRLNIDTDEHHIFLERKWYWLRDVNDIEVLDSICGSLLGLSFCPSGVGILPGVYTISYDEVSLGVSDEVKSLTSLSRCRAKSQEALDLFHFESEIAGTCQNPT